MVHELFKETSEVCIADFHHTRSQIKSGIHCRKKLNLRNWLKRVRSLIQSLGCMKSQGKAASSCSRGVAVRARCIVVPQGSTASRWVCASMISCLKPGLVGPHRIRARQLRM
jgi:hypothetical protein